MFLVMDECKSSKDNVKWESIHLVGPSHFHPLVLTAH